MCFCYCGWAVRIFLVALNCIFQGLIHVSIVAIGYSMLTCGYVPKPSNPLAMFTYMGFFYRRDCMNLEEVGFPPNWTSPPSDNKTIEHLRRGHLPSWEEIQKWLGNPDGSEKFFKKFSGLKLKPKSEERVTVLPENDEDDAKTNKYRSLILDKGREIFRNRREKRFVLKNFDNFNATTTRKPWLTIGSWEPVANLEDLPKWVRRPEWFENYWYGSYRTMASYKIAWPERAKQTGNSLRFIITYFVMDALWLITTVLLILAGICKVRGLKAVWFFLPWILVTIGLLIIDVAATVYYFITIVQTSSWYNFLYFMGVTNMQVVSDPTKIGFPDYGGVYNTPAKLITFFVSRIGIFWILNFICLIVIIKIFCRALNQRVIRRKCVIPGPPVYCPPPPEPKCLVPCPVYNCSFCPSFGGSNKDFLCHSSTSCVQPIPFNQAPMGYYGQNNCPPSNYVQSPIPPGPQKQSSTCFIDYLLNCC